MPRFIFCWAFLFMRKEIFSVGERYHVYNRGANRANIFLDQEDREKFLWNMLHFQYDARGRQRIALSAYALMDNHFHFALQQLVDGGISSFVSRVCLSYAMYFNKKYQRKGCVFSGRFQVRHVDNENYFLHLTRYIHRNPVEIVGEANLGQYPWSSYLTYMGIYRSPIVTDALAQEILHTPREYEKFMQSWRSEDEEVIACWKIDDGDGL
jgi:REP element-mobilizing transposase RayT